MQQQLSYATDREQEASAAAAANGALSQHQPFAQPGLFPQARGGDNSYFPDNRTGRDPRLEYFLLQQRMQQERINELAMLEQQRLASLDPELQMRLLRGGAGAYGGFPTGNASNLLSQQLPFDSRRFDQSSNAAASANERFMSMQAAAAQQNLSPAAWMAQNDAASGSEAAARAAGNNTSQETTDGSAPASTPQQGLQQQQGSESAQDPQLLQLYLLQQQQQQREQEHRVGRAPP